MGFERPDNFDYENYEDFMAHYLSVLAKRSQKWESHLHRHSLDSTNVRKCMYLSRSSILSIVVQMPDHAVSRFACLHRRALCMTKLMPVTHFGGHMDVTVKPVYKLYNACDDLKWTTNTHVISLTVTSKV